MTVDFIFLSIFIWLLSLFDVLSYFIYVTIILCLHVCLMHPKYGMNLRRPMGYLSKWQFMNSRFNV